MASKTLMRFPQRVRPAIKFELLNLVVLGYEVAGLVEALSRRCEKRRILNGLSIACIFRRQPLEDPTVVFKFKLTI